jgi:energy-converting hydrogenase Eha subunit A
VIGLYLAFAVPIFLRWRMGDAFEPGSWTLGKKYKWMNLVAVAEIIIVSLYLMMPSLARGNPLHSGFSWKFVNYSPIVLLGSLLVLTIWWITSAKNWFTGPKHTIDQAVLEAFGEDKLTAD